MFLVRLLNLCFSTVSFEPQFALYFIGLYDGFILIFCFISLGSIATYNNFLHVILETFPMLVCTVSNNVNKFK